MAASDINSLMSIGELAERTGVSRRTIRYYEELGILPEAPRSEGGTRRYPNDYVFYVEGAVALKELGFTLEEIGLLGRLALGAKLTKRHRAEAEDVLTERMAALEHRIRVLDRIREVLLDRSGLDDRPPAERLSHVLRETSSAGRPLGERAS